jgi:hypothetical protein
LIKERLVPLPHLPVTVYVCVTEDILSARKRPSVLEDIGPFDASPGFIGGLCSFENGIGYIFINPDTSNDTIAHECFHMVFQIMDYIGSSLSEESNEIYAYHLGHIVKEVDITVKQYNKDKD